MKYKCAIFDLFGTLVDDFLSWASPMNDELVKALAVQFDPFMDMWRQSSEMRTIGKFQTVEASIDHVCDAMGIRVGAEQLKAAVEVRMKYIKRALEPRADAVATLTRLRNEGCRTGLLSNCSLEIPMLWLETAFAELMDSVVFSCRERLRKPDPRIYRLVCDRLGVNPVDCVYVADGENYELAGAAEAGLHPVLIRTASQNKSKSHQEAREWQGDTIAGLADVLSLVSA